MEVVESSKGKPGDTVKVEIPPEIDQIDEDENKVVEPKPGMKFADDDEMYEFYRNYGEQTGFPVRRKSSKKGDDGVRRYVTFACSRGGKSSNTSSNPLKSHPSIRIGCKARIAACLDVDGRYRLNSVVLEHNHELSPSKARHFRCNRAHRYHYSQMLHSDHNIGEHNLEQETASVRMEEDSSDKGKPRDTVEVGVPENDKVNQDENQIAEPEHGMKFFNENQIAELELGMKFADENQIAEPEPGMKFANENQLAEPEPGMKFANENQLAELEPGMKFANKNQIAEPEPGMKFANENQIAEPEPGMKFVNENQIAEPEPGMKFADDDEMFEFYRNYGEQTGFAVSRKSSKKGDDGVKRYVTFACSRARKSRNKSNNPLKSPPSIRIGCKARIAACVDVDGKYRLNSVALEHNHELNPKKARHFRCNQGAHMERRIDINGKGRTKVNKNCNYTNDIENVKRLRLGEGGLIAIQNYFSKMQSQSPIFFFGMDLDEEGGLKNVFWADGRSREAYKEFGEVVTFETTYLTNKYEMPLVAFVGVNHHGQSTLLGCGLVCSEDIETYCWLFQTWLACMSGCAPNGIITDQDSAVKRAIEIVFPNTRHRWFLWHVMKRLLEKLSGNGQYDSICFELQEAVYDSQSPSDFEHSWSVMVDKYELHNHEWLAGLYNERHRWVPCFVKTSFWAGMSTTQRSEQLAAFFDEYINSKTTLKQFVEKYDDALRNSVEKESEADLKSYGQLVPCLTIYEMEKQVRAAYTISIFKEFQKELTERFNCEFTLISTREDFPVSEYGIRENNVAGEGKKEIIYKVTFHRDGCEVSCNCNMFEFRGILCRHAISVLLRNDVELIPEKYILYRWRKDVTRPHTLVKINRDGYSVTSEQLRYDNMCTAFNNVAKSAAGDEESYIGVMEWIKKTTMERPLKRINDGSNLLTPQSVYTSSGNNSHFVGNQLV